MQKDKYIEAYDQLVDLAIEEADKHFDILGTPKEKRDYGEWISEAETEATAAEVVGYYLEAHPDDYFPVWLDNTTGIYMTEKDKEVSVILNKLWDEQFGHDDLDVYKAIECCIMVRKCVECPYKKYRIHCCRPLLIKDTAHHFGRLVWESKEEKAMTEQWAGDSQ